MVTGNRMASSHIRRQSDAPIRIPVGGKQWVRLGRAKMPPNAAIELTLNSPPPGISIDKVKVGNGGISFVVLAGPDAKLGTEGNLIVDIVAELKRSNRVQRQSAGVLPAIPFKIVEAKRSS
jgi:hypothetical protein